MRSGDFGFGDKGRGVVSHSHSSLWNWCSVWHFTERAADLERKMMVADKFSLRPLEFKVPVEKDILRTFPFLKKFTLWSQPRKAHSATPPSALLSTPPSPAALSSRPFSKHAKHIHNFVHLLPLFSVHSDLPAVMS